MLHNPIRNDFFGLCITLAYYFRILPSGFENREISFATHCYTWIIYFLAIFCHLSEIFKLFQLLSDDHLIIDEIIRNYVITSYHFSAMIKCFFLRSKLSGKLFNNVIEYEEGIYKNENPDVLITYQLMLSFVQNLKQYYLAGVVAMVFCYIAAAKLSDPYYIQKGNTTLEIPRMPISSWTPVDDHYWFAYAWTSLTGAYLTIFFVTSDMTCFSFLLFGICQLKILKDRIQNFHSYSEEISRKHGYKKAHSFRELQRNYIIMHQEIISYVKDLNNGLKTIMILDFLPSSLQLAGLIYQLMAQLSIIQFILLGQFISILIARIFIYCLSAHNLASESQNIAHAWYNIDWTELPRDVQKNIVLCIARSQKPLLITVGNFGNISAATFLIIMKGTYTYMMFLTTVRRF